MKKINFWHLALAGILVFTFVLLAVVSKKDSQTTDEGIHLFAGYTYLTKNDFRLDPEHPPFLKEIAALPLLFISNLNAPIDGLWEKAGNFYYDSWEEARSMSESFLYSVGNNADKLLFWGRFPFVILTLLLGLFTYFWANRLYGQKAGVFAAFLTLFLPNILAHGHLINTDLGVTFFIFVGLYFWGKYLKQPAWFDLLLAGLFIGLAFASKFTSVTIIPIMVVLAVIKLFIDKNAVNWGKYLLGLLGIGIIGFLIVWATYGFSTAAAPVPIGSFSENIRMWANYNIPTVFDGIFNRFRPYLIPADFYKGFVLVARHALGGHAAFLLGNTSAQGWWYYFPVAIFYKTPLVFFVFLGLAIIFFKKIRSKIIFDELILIIVPVLYLLISMNSKADLGVRHILPIFPYLAVFAAKSINLIDLHAFINKRDLKITAAAVIFTGLVGWYFVSSMQSYPNFLSYFNEAAGGPNGGYKILTDSNLDWGQDIKRIKDYIDTHPNDKIGLTYPWDGDSALSYYGLKYPLVRPDDIDITGDVIISATYADTDAYSWLWHFPYEQIMPGIFIFHISEQG